MSDDRSCWTGVTEMMAGCDVMLGPAMTSWFDSDPGRVLCWTTYYKFAAKMIGRGRHVLEVDCDDGLGSWILAAECGRVTAVDPRPAAVELAMSNWSDSRVRFHCADQPPAEPGGYQAVVSFRGLADLSDEQAGRTLAGLADRLAHDGIAVLGVPCEPSAWTPQRLDAALREHFHHVFLFVANEEIIQAGPGPGGQFLLAVGCRKKAA